MNSDSKFRRKTAREIAEKSRAFKLTTKREVFDIRHNFVIYYLAEALKLEEVDKELLEIVKSWVPHKNSHSKTSDLIEQYIKNYKNTQNVKDS